MGSGQPVYLADNPSTWQLGSVGDQAGLLKQSQRTRRNGCTLPIHRFRTAKSLTF